MKSNELLAKSNQILTWITDNKGVTYMETNKGVTFYANDSFNEMLKITPDGFYVRGIKVPQDEREAESVYKTFHQWLTWATLNRTY